MTQGRKRSKPTLKDRLLKWVLDNRNDLLIATLMLVGLIITLAVTYSLINPAFSYTGVVLNGLYLLDYLAIIGISYSLRKMEYIKGKVSTLIIALVFLVVPILAGIIESGNLSSFVLSQFETELVGINNNVIIIASVIAIIFASLMTLKKAKDRRRFPEYVLITIFPPIFLALISSIGNLFQVNISISLFLTILSVYSALLSFCFLIKFTESIMV